MEKGITWKIEKRKISDLIQADYNPRKIGEKDRADLQESIDKYGMVVPLVINSGSRNNRLIGGHQRLGIYGERGLEEVDVMVPSRELTIEEEMRLNLRLNKNTGEWDDEKLQDLNVGMLLEVGFGDEELSNIFDNVELLGDDEFLKKAIDEAKKETNVKPGEIYQLGNHRLMCGNAGDENDVGKLIGEGKIDMVYCDPPYNIGLDYSKGVGSDSKYGGAYTGKDDSKKDSDYSAFIESSVRNALKFSNKRNLHVFYWCDERYIWLLQTIFSKIGLDNKRVCFWVKNNASPTPQVAFNKVYEPCVYATKGRPFLNPNYKNLNEIMNREIGTGNEVISDIIDIFNLWIVKRDTVQDYEHPTQKPIVLHEKPLKRCAAPGGGILDLFGGSGSTLMACEQLNRKCFMMELDPVFCQVIINRWQEYTGQKAKKI